MELRTSTLRRNVGVRFRSVKGKSIPKSFFRSIYNAVFEVVFLCLVLAVLKKVIDLCS